MKIIAGQYKGRNFYTPYDIRPTQNLVRKAFFDILGQDLPEMSFLDLFAGSGAMGLEAVSRGASLVVFVENEPDRAVLIEKNIEIFGISLIENVHRVQVIAADAFATIKYLASQQKKFDIIFLDPPYDRELAKKALKTLNAYAIVHPNCIVAIQHARHEILPESEGKFSRFREKKYGNTVLSFYKIT